MMRKMAVVMAAIAVLYTSGHPAASDANTRSLVMVEPGNLHRLKLVATDVSHLQVEYPLEELKFKRTGRASVAFRLGPDDHASDPIAGGLYTSEVFYQAAVKVIAQLRMEYIEGSWHAPINRFAVDVVFGVPPCLAETPWMNIDLQVSVCASGDALMELKWEKPAPPNPAPSSEPIPPAQIDCSSPVTTLEINECLEIALKEAETTLNGTYQRVIRELSQPDLPGLVHYAEAKQDLIKAQRAWITFREKDCSAVYALAVGGSMRGQLFLECMQRRTEQRIGELEKLLEP